MHYWIQIPLCTIQSATIPSFVIEYKCIIHTEKTLTHHLYLSWEQQLVGCFPEIKYPS